MTMHTPIASPNSRLARHSMLIEKTLEYHLSGAITGELLRRNQPWELLRTDCDRDGYDLVIEAGGVTRHIQLKAQVQGGASREITAHVNLANKPSACIIWMTYDPATLRPVSYRFFGGTPASPIPALGNKPARHSRGNKDGLKGERPLHRVIPVQRFEPVIEVADLVDRLFGAAPDPEWERLIAMMASANETAFEPWLAEVRSGNFAAIPQEIDWDHSAALADLIDGYALANDLGFTDTSEFLLERHAAATASGFWPGQSHELWLTLFLEHRRQRFAGREPDTTQRILLDRLVQQLREGLVR
ncbi:hypothetical protein [Sphingobium aromaticiconvertens]|uniref:hypothetical protein n=1 Tax=Sphingobium aromaticiconvertens TaxID=365341 RepID=UPI003017A6F9